MYASKLMVWEWVRIVDLIRRAGLPACRGRGREGSEGEGRDQSQISNDAAHRPMVPQGDNSEMKDPLGERTF